MFELLLAGSISQSALKLGEGIKVLKALAEDVELQAKLDSNEALKTEIADLRKILKRRRLQVLPAATNFTTFSQTEILIDGKKEKPYVLPADRDGDGLSGLATALLPLLDTDPNQINQDAVDNLRVSIFDAFLKQPTVTPIFLVDSFATLEGPTGSLLSAMTDAFPEIATSAITNGVEFIKTKKITELEDVLKVLAGQRNAPDSIRGQFKDAFDIVESASALVQAAKAAPYNANLSDLVYHEGFLIEIAAKDASLQFAVSFINAFAGIVLPVTSSLTGTDPQSTTDVEAGVIGTDIVDKRTLKELADPGLQDRFQNPPSSDFSSRAVITNTNETSIGQVPSKISGDALILPVGRITLSDVQRIQVNSFGSPGSFEVGFDRGHGTIGFRVEGIILFAQASGNDLRERLWASGIIELLSGVKDSINNNNEEIAYEAIIRPTDTIGNPQFATLTKVEQPLIGSINIVPTTKTIGNKSYSKAFVTNGNPTSREYTGRGFTPANPTQRFGSPGSLTFFRRPSRALLEDSLGGLMFSVEEDLQEAKAKTAEVVGLFLGGRSSNEVDSNALLQQLALENYEDVPSINQIAGLLRDLLGTPVKTVVDVGVMTPLERDAADFVARLDIAITQAQETVAGSSDAAALAGAEDSRQARCIVQRRVQ